ncbi:hypothetical protein O4215_20890 [Rhodococcus maanshanensis]|uniref:hypothetical protein n=1 Tax=Rhodococcus maanshanensis TaxID=183556 RepID=UPI0022B30F22|nr:hypothetical protein [Rhodococcus maanshanensis]MCZ4558022.1 hypothetical protein [Rhodococcus maanshanensis]
MNATGLQTARPGDPDAVGWRPLPLLLGRWALILGSAVFAFWPAVTLTVRDTQAGGNIGYIVVMPVLCVIMTLGIARRRHGELPIHDREIDFIVGGMALALSVATAWLLVPRYAERIELLRLDLYALVVFLFGGCVLMFGLRAAGRFWPIWLVLILFGPLPYQMLVVGLGGNWRAIASASVLIVAVSVGIAVARSWRRGVAAAVVTGALGLVLLAGLDAVVAGAPGAVAQLLPALVAGIAVFLWFVGYTYRHREPNAALTPQRMPTVTAIRTAVVPLLAAAFVLWLTPWPPVPSIRIDTGPPLTATPGMSIPPGWTQTGFETGDWAERYFGEGTTLVRQSVTADKANPDWDSLGRARTVVVDSLQTTEPFRLKVYPGETLYSTIGSRRSAAQDVDLGHGVHGILYTVVDEELFLTWTKLSFVWTRGDDVVEAVNLISVDNHEPGAEFPQRIRGHTAIAAHTFDILLRGNAVAIDDNPTYEDRDLLTTFGTQLVAQQWEGAP